MDVEINIKEEVTTPPPTLQSTAEVSTNPQQSELEKLVTTNNPGITISEYLVNNYPPSTQTATQGTSYFDDHLTMVPPNPASDQLYNQYSEVDAKDLLDYPINLMTMADEEKKRIKRRMKNKISAQESRRRKKEYVDTLETRLKQKDQETVLLKEKVTELEEKYRCMVDELFSLKQEQSRSLSSSINKHPYSVYKISRASQTGTCLDCFVNRRGESSLPSNLLERNDHPNIETSPKLSASSSKMHFPERPTTFSPITFKNNLSTFNYFQDSGANLSNQCKERSSLYNNKPYNQYGRASIPSDNLNGDKCYKSVIVNNNNKTDSYVQDGRRSNESKKYFDEKMFRERRRYSLDYRDNSAFTYPSNIHVIKPTATRYGADPSFSSIYKENNYLPTDSKSFDLADSKVSSPISNYTSRNNSSIMETSSLFSQLMNTEHVSSPSHT